MQKNTVSADRRLCILYTSTDEQ